MKRYIVTDYLIEVLQRTLIDTVGALQPFEHMSGNLTVVCDNCVDALAVLQDVINNNEVKTDE
jgi:hypothetical protein